eukprot:tig00020614_g12158.t1
MAERSSKRSRVAALAEAESSKRGMERSESMDLGSGKGGHGHESDKYNIGTYLAARLEEIGVEEYFVVPGDYNLVLLDQFLKNKNMTMVSCCNELNAGYAADGYARAKGVGVVVVTFCVGGFSVVNAVAGAYSDDLPVICISGGPNSNDFGTNRILHHTTGLEDKFQQFNVFKNVTVEAVIINNVIDAPRLIDQAISAAMTRKKPVYIEVSCNLSAVPCAAPVPMRITRIPRSNPMSLEGAVEAAFSAWKAAVKPVLVAGVKLRCAEAEAAFVRLADAAGCAVAIMPNAKSFFPEQHPQFIGTYWGMASSPCVCETVEACDLYLFAGPLFNDYTTVGYSTLIKKEKMIEVGQERLRVPSGQEFGSVSMGEFLDAFAEKIKSAKAANPASLTAFKRLYEPERPFAPADGDTKLATKVFVQYVQRMLTGDNAVLVETGDSWFNGQKLRLPEGALYEFQMQYGSIGWSVGAVLGYAFGLQKKKKRVISMIGDGSFQMTAQEVSTMIRYDLNPIIFLLNNRGYTIEVEIHDGPYNNIKNWDYVKLIQTFAAGEGNVFTTRVDTEGQLAEAIKQSLAHKGLCFIEVTLDRDDCSNTLLEWGSRVANANGRPDKRTEDF